jgi:hypothetical protein
VEGLWFARQLSVLRRFSPQSDLDHGQGATPPREGGYRRHTAQETTEIPQETAYTTGNREEGYRRKPHFAGIHHRAHVCEVCEGGTWVRGLRGEGLRNHAEKGYGSTKQ